MGDGLKDFFDHAYFPTQRQVTNKPYAAFLTHGGGGKAIQSIESIAQTFKLEKVADSVLVQGYPEGQGSGCPISGAEEEGCVRAAEERVGFFMGEIAQGRCL